MAGQPKARTNPRSGDTFTNLRRTALGRGDAELLQALRDLVHVRRVLPRAVNQLELLASPLRAATTDGTGGSSGIPDPTPLGGEYARWAMQGEEIAARLAEVTAGMTILRRLVDQVPTDLDVKAEASRLRCTGGTGMDGNDEWRWVGPEGEECFNIAAPGRKDGLCDRCRQREGRWARGQPPDEQVNKSA